MQFSRSQELHRALCDVTPGGVNSPFRGFSHVTLPGEQTSALILKSAQGARVRDVDDNEYIDYVGAWGPMILGHRPPAVADAVRAALEDGWILGTSTPWELEFARAISRLYPSMEMVRFVNSGAEAVQSAVRLARAFTGCDTIIKMEGCYHGHVESLDGAGPRSGVPRDVVAHTLTVPFNDAPALHRLLQQHRAAAVIMEPVPASMGVVPPLPEYLAAVRKLTLEKDVLLIFDEVFSGFRVALGGAQEYYGVRADITVLGKILGGGFPAGAYGASREIMHTVAPLGPMYQAGTFCGNPITMRAGLATLQLLTAPGTYQRLESLTAALTDGMLEAAQRAGIPLQAPHVGSMFAFLFTDRPVRNATDYASANERQFAAFFHQLLAAGHFFPPSQSDAAVVSLAHTEQDIAATIEAAANAFRTERDTCPSAV